MASVTVLLLLLCSALAHQAIAYQSTLSSKAFENLAYVNAEGKVTEIIQWPAVEGKEVSIPELGSLTHSERKAMAVSEDGSTSRETNYLAIPDESNLAGSEDDTNLPHAEVNGDVRFVKVAMPKNKQGWLMRNALGRKTSSDDEKVEEAMPEIVQMTNSLLGAIAQALSVVTNLLLDSWAKLTGWTQSSNSWCACCDYGTCGTSSMIDEGRKATDAPDCFNPDVPNSEQCTECFDKAKADCTTATNDKGEDLSTSEKEIAIGLCLAHLACEDAEPWTADICVSWKCVNCRKFDDPTNSCPTPAPTPSLLDTSHNFSKVAMSHRDMEKAKTFAAVLHRGKESVKARHLSARQINSAQGKFDKLDTSTQGKCQA